MSTPSYCASCGQPVDPLASFCGQCGAATEVRRDPAHPTPETVPASEPDPGLGPAPAVDTGTHTGVPAEVVAESAPPPPRSRTSRNAVVVAAAVTLAVAGGGAGLVLARHGGDDGSRPGAHGPSAHPTSSASASGGPTTSDADPTATATTVTPADAAREIGVLLRQEVQAHRADNVAVGRVASCTATDADVAEIGSFRDQRSRLADQLDAIPGSGDPELDGARTQLVTIWRELVLKDDEYAVWAQAPADACPRPDTPSTSLGSKQRRAAWLASWTSLVSQHPEWRVRTAQVLEDEEPGAYLLL